MKTQTEIWQNLVGKTFYDSIENLLEDAIIRELANGYSLKVCVGSDSQVYGGTIYYATAIVVIRKGKGAFTFIRKEKEGGKINIKERMLKEVNKAIEIAYRISEIVENYNIEMEVHVDINTHADYKSNVALKEAMGYILGMGYNFQAKPFAFASSNCADLVV